MNANHSKLNKMELRIQIDRRDLLVILSIVCLAIQIVPKSNALFVFPERAHSSQVAPENANERGGRSYASDVDSRTNNNLNSNNQKDFGHSAIIPQSDQHNKNHYNNLREQFRVQSTNNEHYGVSSNNNDPENNLDKLTNAYPIDGVQTEQFKSLAEYETRQKILEETQGRFFDHKKKKRRRRKKRRKRPCIPFSYRPPKDGGRLYPVNLVYVEVNEHNNIGGNTQYKPTSGYYCRPRPMFGLHDGISGLYDYFFGDDDEADDDDFTDDADDNLGVVIGNDDDGEDDEVYDEVVGNNSPVNGHGSLLSPAGGVATQQVVRPQNGNNYYGNNYGSNSAGNSVNNHNGGNQANGGPLGFFGQGGLFDINSGYSTPRPSAQNPYTDTRPVHENNVGDIVNNALNYRPNNNLVGGIQNTVNGFVQQVARPGRALYSTLVEPFVGLFV